MLNAQVIKQDKVSESIIILGRRWSHFFYTPSLFFLSVSAPFYLHLMLHLLKRKGKDYSKGNKVSTMTKKLKSITAPIYLTK